MAYPGRERAAELRPGLTTLAGKVFRAPLNAAFRFFAIAAASLAFLTSGAALALTAPKWADLTAQQREILKPLAGDWDKLDEARRNKWVVVAKRYPTMQPEEQKRLQGRMADWARLTPEQRRVARENFQRTKALPPEQKKAEWQQYQTLPETQKQRLAETVDERKPARQKARQREQEGKVVAPVPPVRNSASTKPAASRPKPPATQPSGATPPPAAAPHGPGLGPCRPCRLRPTKRHPSRLARSA